MDHSWWIRRTYNGSIRRTYIVRNECYCMMMSLVEVIKTKGWSIQGVCWPKSYILPNPSQLCCYATVWHQPVATLQILLSLHCFSPILTQKGYIRAASKKTRGQYTPTVQILFDSPPKPHQSSSINKPFFKTSRRQEKLRGEKRELGNKTLTFVIFCSLKKSTLLSPTNTKSKSIISSFQLS